MTRFFVDAETDGLYGPFLSVAALVTNPQGQELDRFYGAISPEHLKVTTPWVCANVVPHLWQAEVFYPDEDGLLEGFWSFWMKYREDTECIADVAYPVETHLFTQCVCRNLPERNFLAPFPLYDLSTLLKARNLPPLESRQTLSGEALTSHDAMNDVRMAAAVWNRLV